MDINAWEGVKTKLSLNSSRKPYFWECSVYSASLVHIEFVIWTCVDIYKRKNWLMEEPAFFNILSEGFENLKISGVFLI